MTDIWRTKDRSGRAVDLAATRWAHVMAEHANDLAGREAHVRLAVERPDFVTIDLARPRRECHYRRFGSGRLMLKVVVGYEPVLPPGTWAGQVITAYPTRHVPRKERPIWP